MGSREKEPLSFQGDARESLPLQEHPSHSLPRGRFRVSLSTITSQPLLLTERKCAVSPKSLHRTPARKDSSHMGSSFRPVPFLCHGALTHSWSTQGSLHPRVLGPWSQGVLRGDYLCTWSGASSFNGFSCLTT